MRWLNSAGVEVSTSRPNSVIFFSISGILSTARSSLPQASISAGGVLGGAKKTYQPRMLMLGIAELGDGRDLGRRSGGLLARGEDHLHLAGAVMLEEIGDAAAAGRDMAALQVGDQRRRAAIGHRLERDADRLAGHHAEEMRERAHRRRAEASARVGFFFSHSMYSFSELTPMVGDTQKAVCTVPARVIGAMSVCGSNGIDGHGELLHHRGRRHVADRRAVGRAVLQRLAGDACPRRRPCCR